MIKRPTWVLVVLLALLAGLAYYMRTVPDNFIQKAFMAGKTPTVETPGTLISLTDGPLNAIRVASMDGHSVALKHETAGWTVSIDDQGSVEADQSAAEQAASQALGMRLTSSTIPVSLSDLAVFGLDKPAYNYQVTLANGTTVSYKIGKETITGDGYYLQKEDGSIVVVDKYMIDSLLNMLKQPPLKTPYTPSPTPLTELPTGTATPTPAAIPTNTPTPGA